MLNMSSLLGHGDRQVVLYDVANNVRERIVRREDGLGCPRLEFASQIRERSDSAWQPLLEGLTKGELSHEFRAG